MNKKIIMVGMIFVLVNYMHVSSAMNQPGLKEIDIDTLNAAQKMELCNLYHKNYPKVVQHLSVSVTNHFESKRKFTFLESLMDLDKPVSYALIIHSDTNTPEGCSTFVYVDPDDLQLKKAFLKPGYRDSMCANYASTTTLYDELNRSLKVVFINRDQLPYKQMKITAFDKLLNAIGDCYHEYPAVVMGGSVISILFTISTMAIMIGLLARLQQSGVSVTYH